MKGRVDSGPTALAMLQPPPTVAKADAPSRSTTPGAAKTRGKREKSINATDVAKVLGVAGATGYRYLSDELSMPV